MEQLYNNPLMAGMQLSQERPAAPKSESSEKDGFQKLLEQKQDPSASQPEKTESVKPAQKTEQPDQAGEKDPAASETEPENQLKTLEEQMVLAAMAVRMQNPLVAEIAGQTPQVLTDPNWEEGLEPVSDQDHEESGLRVVSWMQDASQTGENQESLNAVAGEWVEAQNEAEAPEVQTEAPEMVQQAGDEVLEVKVETIEAPEETEETPELQDAEVETPVIRDLETAPVKETEAPAPAEEAEPVEKQVSAKLAEAVREGATHVEIQLNPENLGKVTVELTLQKDGGLVVHLHAENGRTQNLLEKNLSGLENLLSRETQQEVRVEVPRQEDSQWKDLYDQQQNQQRQQRQEQRRRQQSGEDFLHQLRLGLIPGDE